MGDGVITVGVTWTGFKESMSSVVGVFDDLGHDIWAVDYVHEYCQSTIGGMGCNQ